MHTKRGFTPARIVALAIIGLIVAGLVSIRVASGEDRVSVPAGAKAGDLVLHDCTYDTEAGALPADCGTLVVPENRSDPDSRLIALPVTRIHARSPQQAAADPIFRLEGGPGITNMTFPQASRYVGDRDLVLVGYRGVDGSSRLDCPEVASAMKHSPDFLAPSALRARADAFRDCADRLQGDGVDLAGYTIGQRIDDFEAARTAFGYDRIDLLSESAGTRAAMIYAWEHPAVIHRSVMVGVNPPGHYVWDPATTEAQLERYSRLCAQDPSCRSRTADLAASMRATAGDIPDRWFGMPVSPGNVRVASFFGFMESTTEAAPLNGPMTLDSWTKAANGDASGFWLQSLMVRLVLPDALVWGEEASIGRADAAAARAYFANADQDHSILGNAGTRFLWANGKLVDGWPAAPDAGVDDHVRPSDVETLLIGGTLDFSTPPNFATDELLPSLSNGHQVVLSEFGHTTDFWNEQQDAGTRLITTFFDSGRVDASQYRHRAIDFEVGMSQGAIAQITLGSMVLLALFTVVTLTVVGVRVRRRGGLGRTSGVVTRSLGAPFFGLGGWFLAAIVAMIAWPSVPIDAQLLVVASMGVPVWLGVYQGWVQRDAEANVRRTGLLIAAAGALLGGLLGFHVVDGIQSVFTAVAGSVVGANLALIVFDIERERTPRTAIARPTSGDAPDREREPALS
jgi:pimeloyl-ACP methyl ester carboxylesterase